MSDDESSAVGSSLVPSRIPAGEPPESYTDLGKEYPLALIAGGLGLGILAGVLLPRGVGRKLARSAITLATVAGEVSRRYGDQVIKVASESTRDGRDEGIRIARQAVKFVADLRR